MLLSDWQSVVHELYQLDSSVPGSSDEDYTVRTNLLKTAIALWSGEEGVLWRELWLDLSDAADGTKVTAAATTKYSCPSDFNFPGGFVRTKEDGVNWTFWKVYDQPKSELFKNPTLLEAFCWFTGNKKVGFSVNFSKQPTPGVTLDYPYYKDPFIPSSSSDVIEMSDPYFAVYYALSKLHENDGEGDRATVALAVAESRLAAMKARNAMMPSYQENYVPDRDLELGISGFGN